MNHLDLASVRIGLGAIWLVLASIEQGLHHTAPYIVTLTLGVLWVALGVGTYFFHE